MAKRRSISKKEAKRIARERMDILFCLARETFPRDRELARRYVSLARKIGMRYNVRLLKKDKILICKNCNSLLVPGVNSRVRTHASRVIITCLDCSHVRRVPFVREMKSKLNKRGEEKSLNLN
jgi:ribonuclease P protein subunit RPR2